MVARVVTCCDAFSAMTTDRPYRKALSVPEAIGELRANAGSQFDPNVAAALLTILERGALDRPSTGDLEGRRYLGSGSSL